MAPVMKPAGALKESADEVQCQKATHVVSERRLVRANPRSLDKLIFLHEA